MLLVERGSDQRVRLECVLGSHLNGVILPNLTALLGHSLLVWHHRSILIDRLLLLLPQRRAAICLIIKLLIVLIRCKGAPSRRLHLMKALPVAGGRGHTPCLLRVPKSIHIARIVLRHLSCIVSAYEF